MEIEVCNGNYCSKKAKCQRYKAFVKGGWTTYYSPKIGKDCGIYKPIKK